MKKLITLVLSLFIVLTSNFSQTTATTSEGKKVILNDDGTWKYEEVNTVEEKLEYNCSDLISTEVDKMTGKSSTSSKETLIISDDGGKSGFGIYLMQGSKSIILAMQVAGASKCIDDDNKMNVLFRDGTRLELIHNGKFNCDGSYTLYFGGAFGKKKELEMFTTKEVETMRVWTSDSYVEKDFTSDQSAQFMKTFDCLNK